MAKESKAKIKIEPLFDRVLVLREEVEQRLSVAGLIIPDSAQKEKSKIGTVMAVGPGRVNDEGKLIATSIKVASKVIFNAGWDNEVSMDDDQEYFLVRESDILGIIK